MDGYIKSVVNGVLKYFDIDIPVVYNSENSDAYTFCLNTSALVADDNKIKFKQELHISTDEVNILFLHDQFIKDNVIKEVKNMSLKEYIFFSVLHEVGHYMHNINYTHSITTIDEAKEFGVVFNAYYDIDNAREDSIAYYYALPECVANNFALTQYSRLRQTILTPILIEEKAANINASIERIEDISKLRLYINNLSSCQLCCSPLSEDDKEFSFCPYCFNTFKPRD